MGLDDIMDAAAVSKRLQISVSAVHQLAKRGTLSSEWLAGKRVWRRDVVDRYLLDAAAQKRRRSVVAESTLFQGSEEIPLDRVQRELEAQAPLGFDPKGLRKGGPK